MKNRVEYPYATEEYILRKLPANAYAANGAMSFPVTLEKGRYQSQTAPAFRLVDIADAVLAANRSKSSLTPSLEATFRRYADKWYAETIRDSSLTRILSNENYLKVIELGPPAVPLILKELEANPAPWFLVLRVLTGHSEVGRGTPGNFEKMAEAWINWGKECGLIK